MRAARKLASMKLTLPTPWLRVYDELKKRQKRCVLLDADVFLFSGLADLWGHFARFDAEAFQSYIYDVTHLRANIFFCHGRKIATVRT